MRSAALLSVMVMGFMNASAMAADPAQPAPTPAAAPYDENQMVCRTMEHPTGTRLGARRECRTQKEWNDAMREHQDMTNKLETRGKVGPNGG